MVVFVISLEGGTACMGEFMHKMVYFVFNTPFCNLQSSVLTSLVMGAV